MSKIYQAIRRAEREGLADIPHRSVIQQDVLQGLKRNIRQPSKNDDSILRDPQPIQNTRPNPKPSACLDIKTSADSKLIALLPSKSIPSEKYRTLRTKIFQMQEEKGLKTLLVTSAGTSDGKTLTAINLALTMALEIDLRVLIVDGDLRRPSVHKYLGIPQVLGLSDYLSEKCSLDEILFRTDLKDFYLVPGGTAPDKPAELLNSHRMQHFLTHVSEKFNWVIFDSPPIVGLADADLLASKVDGVIFVVRAFHTPTDLLMKSMESLTGKNLLGVVLNCHEEEETSKYPYYYRSSSQS